LLARETFDVVFMDCSMPDMDGFETTRRIRDAERGGTRAIPIIALTADVTTRARERCVAAGMNDYISKPVMAEQLYQTLRRWLPAAGDQRIAEAAPDAALSFQAALDRLGGDRSLLRELAGIFLGDRARLIGAVRESAAAHNRSALERSAHAIKGAVSNFTNGPAYAAAAQLETLARNGQLAEVEAYLAPLEQSLAELDAELRRMLETSDILGR
jgi:two-component system sensor histidine kinase/response regulator